MRKIRIEHVESIFVRSELCSKHTENVISDRQADALTDVLITCAQLPELGGLGLTEHTDLTEEQESEILFLVSAWREALNSADRAKAFPTPLRTPPGYLIRVDVDWVIASEASWAGMESTYNRLRKPGIFRNDRFWLAGDHVVDPRINSLPKVQALIDASERAKRVFKLTDYQGMNKELGGITGVFAPGILMQRFIQKRRTPRHKTATIYMKPDDDAQYGESHETDLSKVQSFIAKYPRPDDVVPVVDCEGTELDGCFIGACTTTEEDPILAALVLEQDRKDNLRRTRDSIIPEFLTEIVEYMEPSESSRLCCEIQSKGRIIRKRVQLLGDFIDTDALAPAEFLIDMKTHEEAGEYCLQCTHPEFRVCVKGSFNIVAVMALLGCGVKCVIAESFAFILQRNMPNLGLLGNTMPEKSFHAVVENGAEIAIDFNDSIINIDGRAFRFNLSPMEREFFHHGGIASAFRKFGSNLFEAMTEGKRLGVTPDRGITEFVDPHPELQCFPELRWTPPPKVEDKEYILISEDIDPPIPRFVVMHGLFYAIPPTITGVLSDDTEQDRNTKDHITQSGWRYVPNLRGSSYIGPAPPLGHGVHRYIFTVVALSEPLRFDRSQRVSQRQIATAMVGKVAGWGQWVGHFERPWPS
ncbi:hypothetical protein BDV39DRAFT_188389 [Aspergillus sergii]|uniref:Phosphatidylethanolamine-binding protein n=1 Tax=Aspergillus sergii TaxID=1034303 RepID=A0A5N6XJ68_9EURO|nr:hypothetical protein BDV39DRAFT_188389 [Aspergillus sergii]